MKTFDDSYSFFVLFFFCFLVLRITRRTRKQKKNKTNKTSIVVDRFQHWSPKFETEQ